ncbi:hypothetical protein F7725_014214 [Dissostichus mawsoni]|uniref:Uncharacterized protein n=1 Tax=Dissostichus mawsoni TaxID=36200 RepID=A0A7J5YVS0_DISMA|nr:hypothetical protein F7725_014214 [Dissostichus mawsoni]
MSKVRQYRSIISSRDICSSTDCSEEAPPSTAMFFSCSIEWLRLQFRNLLRLSALVKFGAAPKCFDFTPSLAVDHTARHSDVQTLAQLVQDALGQVGLGLIQHDSRTWQRDQRQAGLGIQNYPYQADSNFIVNQLLQHLHPSVVHGYPEIMFELLSKLPVISPAHGSLYWSCRLLRQPSFTLIHHWKLLLPRQRMSTNHSRVLELLLLRRSSKPAVPSVEKLEKLRKCFQESTFSLQR